MELLINNGFEGFADVPRILFNEVDMNVEIDIENESVDSNEK
jgi:hypothetical protein